MVKLHNAGFVNGLPGHHECQCQSKGLPLCTLSGNALSKGDPLIRKRLSYHHVSTEMMTRLSLAETAAMGHKYTRRVGVFDLDKAKVIHVRKAKAKSAK